MRKFSYRWTVIRLLCGFLRMTADIGISMNLGKTTVKEREKLARLAKLCSRTVDEINEIDKE